MDLHDRIATQLKHREENNALRKLQPPTSLIDFASNDYLGLSRSQELRESIDKIQIHSNGSTGSRLLTGNLQEIEKTEDYLAHFFKSDKTLIFNSGYSANLAVFSALPQRGDTIIYDELAHASIKDGARLSMARRFSFKHNDLTDLEIKLNAVTSGNTFIAIESAYSMDGHYSPLAEIVKLAKAHAAYIILDEAHTTGIAGASGEGTAVSMQIQDDIFIRVYTFGKAMGIHGAAITCSKQVRDYVVNFSRPFIYTTAPNEHFAISIRETFEYLKRNTVLIHTLHQNIDLFNKLYTTHVGDRLVKVSDTHPVQSIIVPGASEVKQASDYLKSQGFDVRPILSPTVRAGEERLRVCLHAYNTPDQIESLIKGIKALT